MILRGSWRSSSFHLPKVGDVERVVVDTKPKLWETFPRGLNNLGYLNIGLEEASHLRVFSSNDLQSVASQPARNPIRGSGGGCILEEGLQGYLEGISLLQLFRVIYRDLLSVKMKGLIN